MNKIIDKISPSRIVDGQWVTTVHIAVQEMDEAEQNKTKIFKTKGRKLKKKDRNKARSIFSKDKSKLSCMHAYKTQSRLPIWVVGGP